MTDVVVVPGAPLLLPEYAGLVDPAPDLRSACFDAVSWLAARHPDRVGLVADGSLASRVGRALLGSWGGRVGASPDEQGLLVVANGSARRGEKAPGHLDERSFGFDDHVDAALRSGEPKRLADLDESLADALLADVGPLRALSAALTGSFRVEVDYAGDPFGVQYWVARWRQ